MCASAEAAMSRSMVLGNDDLLGEILLRVDSPTSLVRAALVAKRWLRGVSGPAFLRRFRARLPPRLLGFYVSGEGVPRPEFVRSQTPSAPELSAAVVDHASFGFDTFAEFSSIVLDSRHGRVLYEFAEFFDADRAPAVRTPLRYSDRGDMAVFPPQPSTWPDCPHAMLLPDDDGDDATCYRLDINQSDQRVSAQVCVLRSGAWTVHCSASANLDRTPEKITWTTLLAGGKLYMVTAGYILGLDLAAVSFFIVELPEGVAFEYYGNLVLGRGDDSALYLFHVKGDKLNVWLRRMHGHGGAGDGEWVLRDTISVKETCGHLVEEGFEPADGDTSTEVVGVGDNAEFVFMELNPSGVVVYMHLGSRRVEKVYQRDLENNDHVIQVHPFYVVWLPVVFPALDADEGEEVHQE